jgi:hypothetical protein
MKKGDEPPGEHEHPSYRETSDDEGSERGRSERAGDAE